MLAKFIKRAAQRLGYDITRRSLAGPEKPADGQGRPLEANRWPVEFSDYEKELASKILRSGMTMVSMERLSATLLAIKYVCEAGVDGDFVECGVWKGGNSILAANLFGRYKQRRKVWCFDTFKGMTEPSEDDRYNDDLSLAHNDFLAHQRDDHNAWCYSPLAEVKSNFLAYDLPLEDVVFVEGDICVTLLEESNLPTSISVLRLDTDWYESTKVELEVLYPWLSPGGVIIVDDYGYWSGAKKAVDEYFASRRIKLFFQYTDATGRAAIKVA